MKLNKDYTFKQIEEFAKDDYDLRELGGLTIGQAFIVLENNNSDVIISFVLTGYNTAQGNIYTCIYSDL